VRVVTEPGPRWMLVQDKFAPYGFMPSSLRGQPAVVLKPGAPHETTPETGAPDGVTHEGTVDLHADGSATLEVEQRYEGKLAILLRSALETLPDAQLKETVEASLLPQSLPGARLVSIEVKNLGDLDAPLVLAMKLEMSSFARARPGELVVAPPFPLHLASLAALPVRETPLYISEKIATRVAVRYRVNLPPGAHVSTALASTNAADGGRTAKVADHAEPGVLVLDRVVDLPAGRVQPGAYAAFQEFARTADSALRRDIVVTLGGT
jgi:cellulose synthase operon protein C